MIGLVENQSLDPIQLKNTLSVQIEQAPGVEKIFTSADIPGEILDLMVVRTEVLKEHPELGKQVALSPGEAMTMRQQLADNSGNPILLAAVGRNLDTNPPALLMILPLNISLTEGVRLRGLSPPAAEAFDSDPGLGAWARVSGQEVLVDELAGCMAAVEHSGFVVDGSMRLRELQEIVEDVYGWALDIDWSEPDSAARVWYVSEEKLEPRLGERFEEPIEPYEQPLAPGLAAGGDGADRAVRPAARHVDRAVAVGRAARGR